MNGARVLVVDNKAQARNAVFDALRDDVDVTAVASGADVVRLVREGQQFDLILCKVGLEAVDGETLHCWLQHEAPLQAKRFMFLVDDASTAVDLVDLGAPSLHRPIKAPSLRRAVLDTLDTWRRRLPA